MAGYALRPEQIGFFNEHGYLSGVRILSDDALPRDDHRCCHPAR